jgi:hypothetical protein
MADYSLVGERLHSIARSVTTAEEVDSFGRSALNRYYYATFLIVRHALGDMRPEWATRKHSEIPELLDTKVVEAFRRRLSAVRRVGAVPTTMLEQWQHTAIRAAKELSSLFEEARTIRVIADYYPETRMEDQGGALVLASCKVSRAHHWPLNARHLSSDLLAVWRDLGL